MPDEISRQLLRGTVDVLVDNLPGFPDNINLTERCTVWDDLCSPRAARLDSIGPNLFLRRVMLSLSAFLQPASIRHGLVLEVGPDGDILRSLLDPPGDVADVTG